MIPPTPRTLRKYCAQSEKTATSPSCKQITQPSGAATPRNSDAHKRIAVPKAFCVLQEHLRPRPKSGKTCRSDTRPGDVGERAERSESSDTTPASYTQNAMRTEHKTATFPNYKQGYAAQRGCDAFGTATRISASLSRRLSAFFGSTHDQAPKAAKFAVLNPGHAGFPKRVERSEGSDTTPIRNAPCFAV